MLAHLLSTSALALDLELSPLVPGADATWSATGADPGDTVVFVFGATRSTDCPPGIDRCIRPGVELGRVVADSDGCAVLTRPIPRSVPEGTYLFQVLVRGPIATASPVVEAPIGSWIAMVLR